MSEPEKREVPFKEVARKFVSYYKPFTFLFVADLVCATLLAAIDLAFPQILNFFVRDFFVNARDAIMGVLPWVAAGLVAMYVVRSLCQYFISCWGHIMGARMEARMRMDLFQQYQRLSFSYYDRNNTGEMMSKLVTDLFDISEVAHHGPENLFIATLKIVGSFTLLMFINVPLTLVMLAVTAVMATYAFVQNYRKRIIFRQNRVRMAGLNARLQDSLGGIRVVKGFGNERIEIDKFGHANEEFIETKELSYRFMGQFQMASSFFTGALYTATIVGGGLFVAQGILDPADMVMYALYIGIFIAPVELLINFTETFQKGYAGFRRFVETLAERPGVENKSDAIDLGAVVDEGIAPSISYSDVRFSYVDGKEVLRGLTLEVPAGSTVALVGPSGGGKTTTCSLLPRFYDVSSGSVKIDGIDVRDATLESLRAQVGIVQQDVYLFCGSIKENIAYGKPGASMEEIEDAARKANIHDFIMELPQQYDTYVGERGTRLSGGQKQRVAIAGILAMQPDCIVLDEPTAMLDPNGREEVMSTLLKLNKEKGITVVLITHYMDEAVLADRVIVMDSGKVLTEGTPDNVFSQVELLKKHRLDVPQATELVYRLIGCGAKIDKMPLDSDECVDLLMEVLK